MTKPWQPYALHILDAVERIRHIRNRGDLTQDQVLYDAAFATSSSTTTSVISTRTLWRQ
jgi:hypothetical protein